MGFYGEHIEPALVSFACGLKPIARQREKITPRAHGEVLEVGFGAGLNLPYYDAGKVTKLYALEPSAAMRKRAAGRLAQSPLPVELLDLPGEEIPLADQSVDCILVTYTMCTIPDVAAALGEMRRVMRPGAQMYFCEHGRAPDPAVVKWQNRLNGVWGRLGGGCNLNRDIPAILAAAGFALDGVEEMYLPGTPKFAGYHYWGAATIAG
ncbi:MAG: class I SAM-dependent methyltransferase [Parvularculaceae bacterium]